MSELSPELGALVLAGRQASLPSEGDSARVLAALQARLGDAAVTSTETAQTTATSGASRTLLGKASLAGLGGLVVLGGIWFLAAHNHHGTPSVAIKSPSVVVASPAPVAPSPSAQLATAPSPPVPDANEGATAANPSAEAPEARSNASRRNRDRLAEEVALLSRAETALHGGKPALALEVLKEHERRFGNGLLKEERIAASVQALCALGRNAEANAQSARLSSKSLHGKPPGDACGSPARP
jgi:hypothetical protein